MVKALLRPACYPHPVDRVELIETHISRVFLAGGFAYKVKKPVDFGFLDFSTLARRHYYCRAELELNRRFAPRLYLDVVPIGLRNGRLAIGARPAIEYAVRMRRFSPDDQGDALLRRGRLTPAEIDRFADYVATLHQDAPTARSRRYGSPAAVVRPVLENFGQLAPVRPSGVDRQQLERLEAWSRNQSAALRGVFLRRRDRGFVRECHGDLHLANMVWADGEPLLFDGIEFSRQLRWIDVINDIAFLAMDLDERGRSDLGGRFVNRYLRQTGDYPGAALLGYYKTYRAMVRAKVLALRLAQAGVSPGERKADRQLIQGYLDLATRYTGPPTAALILTHGPTGTGKTTLVERLAPLIGAITLHSDAERKRLHHLAPHAASGSGVAGGIYTPDADAATYARLEELAETLLRAGITVVVDATFLKHARRDALANLADRLKVPLAILSLAIPEREVRNRIRCRERNGEKLSEGNEAVLELQLRQAEPLTRSERSRTVVVSPGSTPESLLPDLHTLIGGGDTSPTGRKAMP